MKVLMIGGDRRSLEAGSGAAARLALQRAAVERLDLFVWPSVHSIVAILSAARRSRYDVITAQDPFWRGLLALVAARFSGAALNIQVHTDLTAHGGLRAALARWILRRADSIRVVSETIRAQVAGFGTRARITVLPVFLDLAPFRAVRPVAHEGKVVLWVGRFEAEKDPLAAIEVFERVRAVIPNARLVMVGDGTLRGTLAEAAVRLAGAVELVGWQQDVTSYLAEADVVLSTSRHESWGESIVEALAAGVPVVAPDVGIARAAGAFVVPRGHLTEHIITILRSGAAGALRLHLPDAHSWAQQWLKTL